MNMQNPKKPHYVDEIPSYDESKLRNMIDYNHLD